MTADASRRPTEESAQEVARILLEQGAVSINVARPFVYSSGIVSPIYCDLRLLMASPHRRGRIVELLVRRVLETCDKAALDVIAGVATAGIPWAAWVATSLGKPMAYVRDAPKGHGKEQQVEGGVAQGQSAIVVEDLTSTGGSAIAAVEGLRAVGARVEWCYSIFTYELTRAKESFKAVGVELVSLCGISTLLDVAKAIGRIAPAEERAVREWLEKGPMAAPRADPART